MLDQLGMDERLEEVQAWERFTEARNETLNWVPSDSEQRYNHNMKNYPDAMTTMGWDDPRRVTYRINSEGFRGGDFVEGGAMFLGCSLTFGIGMPEEDIWPSIVARELNLPCINLGVPGGANDSIFRMANEWIPKLKPKIVFMMSTYKQRFEVFENGKQQRYLPSSPKFLKLSSEWYTDVWLSDDRNSDLNSKKNILAVKMLCNEHNIPIYDDTIFENNKLKIGALPFARDLMHPSFKWHKTCASHFLNKLA